MYNPSYEDLYKEETNPALEGYEKGQESELGAVNVMTGIYTCLLYTSTQGNMESAGKASAYILPVFRKVRSVPQ